ncbi:MAG: hypothetical protein PHS44_05730 [Candidatus Dojkabacteria bacterium]|jgi:hypothetical protein|nr:hypothetical protein [Candidatus Dojkabacteria bacterium]
MEETCPVSESHKAGDRVLVIGPVAKLRDNGGIFSTRRTIPESFGEKGWLLVIALVEVDGIISKVLQGLGTYLPVKGTEIVPQEAFIDP